MTPSVCDRHTRLRDTPDSSLVVEPDRTPSLYRHLLSELSSNGLLPVPLPVKTDYSRVCLSASPNSHGQDQSTVPHRNPTTTHSTRTTPPHLHSLIPLPVPGLVGAGTFGTTSQPLTTCLYFPFVATRSSLNSKPFYRDRRQNVLSLHLTFVPLVSLPITVTGPFSISIMFGLTDHHNPHESLPVSVQVKSPS